MDENQLIALFDQENSYYLTKTLEPVVSDFLDSLQFRAKVISSAERTVVETGLSPAAQLCRLFGILKNKDSGWPALIVYLKENDYNSHAIRLQKSAGEMPSSSVIKAPGSSSPSLNSSYQR